MSFKTILILFFIIPASLSYSQYDPDYNDEDEDLSQLAFKDRLYTGGNVWAQFGSITNLEIAPILGYKITKEYSVGVGAKYNYYRVNTANSTPWSTSIYGGSVFTRYLFFDRIVAHAEFEALNGKKVD